MRSISGCTILLAQSPIALDPPRIRTVCACGLLCVPRPPTPRVSSSAVPCHCLCTTVQSYLPFLVGMGLALNYRRTAVVLDRESCSSSCSCFTAMHWQGPSEAMYPATTDSYMAPLLVPSPCPSTERPDLTSPLMDASPSLWRSTNGVIHLAINSLNILLITRLMYSTRILPMFTLASSSSVNLMGLSNVAT